jgi:pimeloyl-ACP methyl ester carboxylesterase
MRARNPDIADHVERDGVRIGYEVFGTGDPTILLMPTWTIIHSRFWKFQVPYLSRYYRVITYDGPGNGRSDRSTDPERYTADAYAADALAVLDECGVDRAIVVGLSLGAPYGLKLAALHPGRVAGLVFVGPALPLTPPSTERADIAETYLKPYPEDVEGWGKYNVAYWYDHFQDFAEFFFGQCFNEKYSTKAIDDSVSWAMESGPQILDAEGQRRPGRPGLAEEMLAQLECPLLVVHGTDDLVHPYHTGSEAARLGSGSLVLFGGSGHIPNVRDPVAFNFALRDFAEGVPV